MAEVVDLATGGKPVSEDTAPYRFSKLSSVKPCRVEWIWPGRIPKQKVTVVDGDDGLGKSTALQDLAARMTRGRPMPDGAPTVPCNVVLLQSDDDLEDTLVPRLLAAGADLDRILHLDSVVDPSTCRPRAPHLVDDLETITTAVRDSDASLLLVDHFFGFLGDSDANATTEMSAAVQGLRDLARDTGAAVIVVRHIRKSGADKASHRGLGSVMVKNNSRAHIGVVEDPEDPERRLLVWFKLSNALRPDSLAYRIDSTTVPAPDGGMPINTAVACWLGASDVKASDLGASGPRTEKQAATRALLEDVLQNATSLESAFPASEIQAEARRRGIPWRTLSGMAKEVGVQRAKGGFDGGWAWWWPASARPRQEEGDVS